VVQNQSENLFGFPAKSIPHGYSGGMGLGEVPRQLYPHED